MLPFIRRNSEEFHPQAYESAWIDPVDIVVVRGAIPGLWIQGLVYHSFSLSRDVLEVLVDRQLN